MASSSSSAAPVVATSSKAPARGPSGPPRSACFPDVPRGASATRVAAPPTEFWAVHGMYYRIPPLYDQLKTVRASETPPGWATYAQWQASFRGGPGPPPRAPGSERMPASRGSLAALRQPGGSGPSGLNSMVPLLPGEDALDDAGVPPTDPRREEYERWRGCWKTIVRRDIARQQRTLITQQKETLAGCRRAALAVQKEVGHRTRLTRPCVLAPPQHRSKRRRLPPPACPGAAQGAPRAAPRDELADPDQVQEAGAIPPPSLKLKF